MRKRYKIVLNLEIDNPDDPFPAGGDYTHLDRIQGMVKKIIAHIWTPGATLTLDKVIDNGEVRWNMDHFRAVQWDRI